MSEGNKIVFKGVLITNLTLDENGKKLNSLNWGGQPYKFSVGEKNKETGLGVSFFTSLKKAKEHINGMT